MVVVFTLEKFRSYIVGSPVTIFTNHVALKYLLSKQDTKPPLTRWILLCQEFNLTIRDKKGVENVVADHLSRLVSETTSEGLPIGHTFPNEQLFALVHCPWYADIVNYLVAGQIPSQWTSQQKRKFLVDIKKYYFDDPYLFKYCPDQLMRRCVSNYDQIRVLTFCHSEDCGVTPRFLVRPEWGIRTGFRARDYILGLFTYIFFNITDTYTKELPPEWCPSKSIHIY